MRLYMYQFISIVTIIIGTGKRDPATCTIIASIAGPKSHLRRSLPPILLRRVLSDASSTSTFNRHLRHLRRQMQEVSTTSTSNNTSHYSNEDYDLLIAPSKELHAIAAFPRAGYQVISLWDGDCIGESPVNMTVPGRSDVSVKSSGAQGLPNETVSFFINITDYQRSHSKKFFETTTSTYGKICIEMMTIGEYSAMGEEDKATFVFNIPTQQSSNALQAYQGVILGAITLLAAILLIVACKQRTKTPVHPDVPSEAKEDFNKTFKETTGPEK